jgi:metal binding Ada-like protein
MTIGVCCLLAILLANPAGEMTVARSEVPELLESGLLISRNEAIADLDRVCVSLVTHTAESAAFERLAAQVTEKLKAEGIEHIECKTGVTPRLHIHIETVSLEGCGQTVYRVQTALSRIVTFTDHRELKVQADVWRVKPVMEAVADPNLSEAVTDAVLTQAEVFAAACQAAKRLLGTSTGQTAPLPPSGEVTAGSQAAQQMFVASKGSSVFHRPDCRWARNIAEHNRVTYPTREAALADGKRPCKSCKP